MLSSCRRLVAVAIATGVAGAACTETSQTETSQTPETSSQTPQAWRLEEDLRIGSIDLENYTLGFVGAILVGPAGEMYLSQPAVHEILVYDATGRFVGRTGRRGTAPGEFEVISDLSWRGDTLVVVDRSLSRATFYSRDLTRLGTASVESPIDPRLMQPIQPRAALRNGSFFAFPDAPAVALADVESVEGMTVPVPAVLLSPAGSPIDTIAHLQMAPYQGAIPFNGGVAVIRLPVPRFTSRWDVAPDGSRIALLHPGALSQDAGSFEVEVLAADGERIFRTTHSFQPLTLSPERREQLYSRMAAMIRGGTSAAAEALVREHVPMPEFHAGGIGFLIARNGDVWIEPPANPDELRWIILDGTTGRELATVTIPPGTVSSVEAVDRDFVWVVARDDLGVSYVVRFRIVR